jgi:hypothetical protein
MDIWKDALARIANTFGVTGDPDVAKHMREFARDALQCETQAEYEMLFNPPKRDAA